MTEVEHEVGHVANVSTLARGLPRSANQNGRTFRTELRAVSAEPIPLGQRRKVWIQTAAQHGGRYRLSAC